VQPDPGISGVDPWLLIVAYLPLGVIGLWRWSVWLLKVGAGQFYRPAVGTSRLSVSVVTPVYNERPEVFTAALESWKANAPTEIIAVIDHADTVCQEIFRTFAQTFPRARLIITTKPGKRPALVDGIRAARGTIVALVDSDTIWDRDVKLHALAPFRDALVGGVATRQNVLAPQTFAQKLFDLQLDQRYSDELPFLGATGNVFRCLSGRTAFYRRRAVLPLLDQLEHETFLGQPVISGDDKCLTYLVQGAGWKTAYQATAVVWTPGMPSLRAFLKQRLRWARNSWRADLKAIRQPWTWRSPVFAVHIVDTFMLPFVSLLGPLYVMISLVFGFWLPAVVIIVWWHATRFIRLSPHFARRPQDLLFLPLSILVSFLFAGIRLYALFSLRTQGWITRWDATRLPQIQLVQRVIPAVATVAVLVLLAAIITISNREVFLTTIAQP